MTEKQDKKHGYKIVFQSYLLGSNPRDVDGKLYKTKNEATMMMKRESKKMGCDIEL